MIEIVAFDLDDTLAESKQKIDPAMARLLFHLLEATDVAVITGGKFEQIHTQVIEQLPPEARLSNLHVLPTSGAQYYRWDGGFENWRQVSAHMLSVEESMTIAKAIGMAAKRLGLWEPDDLIFGDRIENRGAQVTFSALGQEAPVEIKEAWDPTGHKRAMLRDALAPMLSGYSVRAGGSTSIDVTLAGMDKAFGMRQLIEHTGVLLSEILFVGDRLEPGGNDYPVKEMGIATLATTGPTDTLMIISSLIKQLTAYERGGLDTVSV